MFDVFWWNNNVYGNPKMNQMSYCYITKLIRQSETDSTALYVIKLFTVSIKSTCRLGPSVQINSWCIVLSMLIWYRYQKQMTSIMMRLKMRKVCSTRRRGTGIVFLIIIIKEQCDSYRFIIWWRQLRPASRKAKIEYIINYNEHTDTRRNQGRYQGKNPGEEAGPILWIRVLGHKTGGKQSQVNGES